LLSQDVDVLQKNSKGDTVLHYFARRKQPFNLESKCARLIVKKWPELRVLSNAQGQTPAQLDRALREEKLGELLKISMRRARNRGISPKDLKWKLISFTQWQKGFGDGLFIEKLQ